jgi:ATP-dependent Clp protease ATP-binding subunit ClpA
VDGQAFDLEDQMTATLTDRMRGVLLRARDLALTEDTEKRVVRVGHLLLALLEDPDSSASRTLSEYCDVAVLRHHLASRLVGPRASLWWEAPDIPYAAESKKALALAEQEADAELERHVRPGDLLRGLFRLEESTWRADPALRSATQVGIDLLDVRTRLLAAGTP